MFSKTHLVPIFLIIIQTLLSYNYAMDKQKQSIDLIENLNSTQDVINLFNATKKQDLTQMKLLLSNNVDINSTNNLGDTALHRAVCVENITQDILNFFIDNKTNFNIQDNRGNTPLHKAISMSEVFNNNETIKFLITNKVTLNIQNNSPEFYTPLHTSILFQNNEITKFLIQNKADITLQGKYGFTPLFLAVRHNYDNKNNEIIAFLVNSKMDLNSKDNNGYTFWHFLAKEGSYKPDQTINLIQYLTNTEIDLRVQDSLGKTIQNYAAEKKLQCCERTKGLLLEKILQVQRTWRTAEERKKLKMFFTLNNILGKSNQLLKIPKGILFMILRYTQIPTPQYPVALFNN